MMTGGVTPGRKGNHSVGRKGQSRNEKGDVIPRPTPIKIQMLVGTARVTIEFDTSPIPQDDWRKVANEYAGKFEEIFINGEPTESVYEKFERISLNAHDSISSEASEKLLDARPEFFANMGEILSIIAKNTTDPDMRKEATEIIDYLEGLLGMKCSED